MRKLSFQDIQSKLIRSNPDVNLAVANFREKTIEQGWSLSRNRPRSADEMKALNYIARITFLEGLRSGAIVYDKEKRVLRVEQYAKPTADAAISLNYSLCVHHVDCSD